ncbi:MAG: helix-turn-helix transcriptional regulator [Bacteroidales bacterium]|nr:helix-turn-helix transcriptional regulator [Bacteroidales bacterium]
MYKSFNEILKSGNFSSPDEFKAESHSSINHIVLINEKYMNDEAQEKKFRKKSFKTVIIQFSENMHNEDSDFISINDNEEVLYKKLLEFINPNGLAKGNPGDSKILSNREIDILKYVALGLTNKEIADKLFISAHTVITHRKNISAKLGIKTIAGFTVYALLNKIILPEEVREE